MNDHRSRAALPPHERGYANLNYFISWRRFASARTRDCGRPPRGLASRPKLDCGMTTDSQKFLLPTITEDDLLAFQSSHFGDDSRPADWFIDAHTALNFQHELAEEDDGLGYYEDGTKRTLTDEQIAMFRHSEIQELLREHLLQRDEEEYQQRIYEMSTVSNNDHDRPHSPVSDTSSLEGDLVGLAKPAPPPARRSPPKRQSSQSSHSQTSSQHGRSSTARKRRKRQKEIPYDERHKRNWEHYIEDDDPIEGSKTHRRIVREMDNQAADKVEMDY